MNHETDHQLGLPLGGDEQPRLVKTTRRANRRIGRAITSQLPIVSDGQYTALPGLPPGGRNECRTGPRPCAYVRCKYHLAREDADHRAGRPGIASVPRDSRGWTLPITGDVDGKEIGTTLRPTWLRHRGLEIERECKAYLSSTATNNQIDVLEIRPGTFDYWLSRLHVGEPVLVFFDGPLEHGGGELIAKAKLRRKGELVFDRAIPEHVLNSSDGVILMRQREVQTCGLDLIERERVMSNEEVGGAIGRHRTLVAREVKRALRKLKAQGVDLRDLVKEGT